MAIRRDFTKRDKIFRGDTKELPFSVVDENGDPEDASAWTLEFVIGPTYPRTVTSAEGLLLSSNRTTVRKTSSDGITVSGSPPSDVLVTLTAADTAALAPGAQRYVLRRTDTDFEATINFGEFVALDSPAVA